MITGYTERLARTTLERDSRQQLQQLLQQGAEAVAAHYDRHCPYCRALLVPEIVTFPAPWLEEKVILHAQFSDCDCDGAQRERARRAVDTQAREKEEKARRLATACAAAGLVGTLADSSFDSFQRRTDWPAVGNLMKKARLFVDAVINETVGKRCWLIMHGRYGTGKTHLAAAIVREAVKAGVDCHFHSWVQYLERLKASWDGGAERTADIVAELQRGKLVVIDDIDKARDPSGWARETLYTILDYRYNARLPTVMTLNYTMFERDPDAPGALMAERFMTRAVIDRILGCTWDTLQFDGPSFRSTITWDVKAPTTKRR